MAQRGPGRSSRSRDVERLGRVLPRRDRLRGGGGRTTIRRTRRSTLAGARLSLAEQGHPADDRPGVEMTAPVDRTRADVVLVVEVDDATGGARAARGGRGAVPRRAVRAAVGRLPLLLRRPRRLPRRDRAAGMTASVDEAVILAGVGDVRVETVADPTILRADRRDRRGARDRDLRRRPLPATTA